MRTTHLSQFWATLTSPRLPLTHSSLPPSFHSSPLLTSPSHLPPPTHKAGNTLDLIFTRCCSSTNLIAFPLQVSDHYLVSFSSRSHPTLPTLPLLGWYRAVPTFALSPQATHCSLNVNSYTYTRGREKCTNTMHIHT